MQGSAYLKTGNTYPPMEVVQIKPTSMPFAQLLPLLLLLLRVKISIAGNSAPLRVNVAAHIPNVMLGSAYLKTGNTSPRMEVVQTKPTSMPFALNLVSTKREHLQRTWRLVSQPIVQLLQVITLSPGTPFAHNR